MKPSLSIFINALLSALGVFFVLLWSVSLWFVAGENFWLEWRQQLIPVLSCLFIALFLVRRQLEKEVIKQLNTLSTDMTQQNSPTGLSNRIIFEDRLNQAISDGRRSGRKFALVLIRVNSVDSIVKAHGQYMLAELLKQIAERLSEGLRETDNISHFEQNLFALLLEVQDQDQVIGLVEKKYLKLIGRYKVYGRELDISIAFGISLYPGQANSATLLYDYAMSALELAKGTSWPIGFYDDKNKTDLSGFTLVQSLRQALDHNEFKLVFQPVIELKGHRTVYLEALLRWRNPDMHGVSIERTIQLAEKNQLIKPLTNWIVSSVCQLIQQLDIKDLMIGINLSMVDLHDHYLPGRIKKSLKKYGIKPGQVMIEITEGQIMQEPDAVVEILSHLGVLGLPLSIDDFGTGQASLTYLKELPVEKLKIDQSFIRDIINNVDDKLIVKATIELAHTLDLKVTAEGVESAEIQGLLSEMECDYAQGYYISRPLEVEQIPAWYQSSGSTNRN